MAVDPARQQEPALVAVAWRGHILRRLHGCTAARAGLNRPDTDLLRALWRVEHKGRVALVCSVHAARRGR